MCSFKFTSKTTSFSKLAVVSKIPVYNTREKGDIRSKKTGKTFNEYSISFDATSADWCEFNKQVSDVVKFINNHKTDLLILSQSAHDINGYLDFPLWSRLSDDIAMQSDFFSPELISLASDLKLDIGFSIYARDSFDDLE